MQRDPQAYRQIAALHMSCLDQGFLATLGPRFLALLYRCMDASAESALITESRDGRIVGFVSGGCGMGPVYGQLIRAWPRLAVSLAPLALQPRQLLGVAEILRHSGARPHGIDLPEHEMFSLAVEKAARGTGVAGRLYRAFEAHCRRRGVSAYRFFVGESLVAAHGFHTVMGARPVAQTEVHKGRKSTIYVRDL
ncbi:GNAT family N-acetyltransferase [Roseovarius sp. TE539]|uniref:GNAT family N-acetyltransferase n=1 Tax=Roseovarius sp. TE539 TaxID=2249812 RepID=UPI000DDE4CF6|nr:GNAT family N-acetyltransferase [Roseovarius sp. TE539]RBI76984.1 GNAT family N-acetyltransferase [Roseovarius sp. TE539]